MTTMFRVDTKVYTDCEGRYTEWVEGTVYVRTESDAKAMAQNIKRGEAMTGDWRIVERTIDEDTFTLEDYTVMEYDYYKEVQRKELAQRRIAQYTKAIEEVEASKVNCKTEKGLARKEKEIAQYRAWLEREEKIIK